MRERVIYRMVATDPFLPVKTKILELVVSGALSLLVTCSGCRSWGEFYEILEILQTRTLTFL